mgnify:CR=1 FL=1
MTEVYHIPQSQKQAGEIQMSTNVPSLASDVRSISELVNSQHLHTPNDNRHLEAGFLSYAVSLAGRNDCGTALDTHFTFSIFKV